MDHVEPGNPKKAAIILRTDETIGMLRASESHSLLIKVIERVASFQKGTINSQRDDYSSSESGESESDEYCADNRIGFHMVMSTRAVTERVFTSRMRDFFQSR